MKVTGGGNSLSTRLSSAINRNASTIVWPFLVFLLTAGLIWRDGAQEQSPSARVDAAFLGWMSANAQDRKAPPDRTLLLVEVNDALISTPAKWPLPPLDYALFLQAIEPSAPSVVAIEPVWSFPRRQAEDEKILAARALTVPKLLLGCQLGRTGLTAEAEKEVVAATALPPGLREVRGDLSLLPEYDEITARPSPDLAVLAPELGPVNLGEAAPRALPLLFRCRGRVLPGFALRAALLALQLTPDRVTVWLGSHIDLGGERRIPIDEAGRMVLDPGSAARVARLGLDDLLLLANGNAPEGLTPPLKGAFVLLGRTDAAVRQIRASDGSLRAPAEWLAAGVQAIRKGQFVRPLRGWETGVIALLSALAGLWVHGRSRFGALGTAAVVLGLYAMTATFVFGALGLWLPLAIPLGVLGLSAALRLALGGGEKADQMARLGPN